MMVGNHDYDLGFNTDFAARLRAYNIHLDKSLVLKTGGGEANWTRRPRVSFNTRPFVIASKILAN
jgi:hypothetical protein